MPTSTQRFRLVGEDDASRAFLEVAAASRLLKSNMDDVSSSALGLGKLIGGTGLIPIAAGAAAAFTELGTALGLASTAGGVFGISLVGQVKSMVEQRQAITQTSTSLSKLAKGTDEYRTTLRLLHSQQAAFNKDFGPAAKGFDDMSDSWAKFLDATSPVTNGVLAKGFDLVSDALPKLVPVSNAAGQAVGGLIGDLDDWVNGPGFAKLLNFLETSGPRDITAFGHIIGNTLGGLAGILENFVGPGDHAAATLERLTKRFDAWGHSKGVSDGVNSFLHYVSDNGPQIDSALESLAQSTPKIATALGQLGSANLTVTSRFLNLIAGLPQGEFNAIADALFAIAAGSKAITLVTGLGAVGKGLKGILSSGSLVPKGGGVPGAVASTAGTRVFVTNMPKGGLGGGPLGTLGKDAEKVATGGGVGGFLTLVFERLFQGTAARLFAGPALLAGVNQGSRALISKLYGDTVGSFFGSIQAGVIGLGNGLPPKIEAQQAKIWGDLLTLNFNAAKKDLNQRGNFLPAPPNLDFGLAPKIGSAIGAGVHNFLSIGSDSDKAVAGIKAVGTALDSARQQAAKASQGLDLIGPHAQGSTGRAITAFANLQATTGKANNSIELVGHSIDRIPPDKKITITANTSSAMAALQNIQIYQIRDKSFTVTQYTNATVADHIKPRRHASGGIISGPGGPRSDSIPALLSNGEFVVNAAATKRNLALLQAINGSRYSNGGLVTTSNRGAGTTLVQVTINAPVGSDAYTIGAELQGFLDEYHGVVT